MKAISTSRLRDNLLKALAISAVAAVPGAAFVPAALAAPSSTPLTPPVGCKLDMTGDGTASNPFLINNEVGLAEINDCLVLGQYFYYKLTKDIVLSPGHTGYSWDTNQYGWTPIGLDADSPWVSQDYPFTGVFDGNGHTISGLSVKAESQAYGLFGLTENAVIKNLNVAGTVDTNGYDNVGGVVGNATYSSSDESTYYNSTNGTYGTDIPNNYGTTISNVKANISQFNADSGSTGIGLVAGSAWKSALNNVSSTNEYFNVYANYYVGGVVGYADQTTVTGASSSANIGNGTSVTDAYQVGGIVGYLDHSSLTKAAFTGSVTGSWNVGGTVGGANYASVSNATVSSAAHVSADPYYDYSDNIGGVVGYDYRSPVSNATFAGTLHGVQQDNYNVYNVGGILGYANGSNDQLAISNVTVTSKASIVVNGDSGTSSVGGVAGRVEDAAISNAVNHADISATDADYVGGLVGNVTGGNLSSIDASLNTGNIDAPSYHNNTWAFGGLVGRSEDTISVSNSGNQGSVSATGPTNPYDIGGIIGYTGDSAVASITDSYNTGDLTGYDQVAGIVGYVENANSSVHGSYSAGAVTATTTYSEESDGIANGQFGDPTANNTVLGGTGIRNRTGANVLTASQLKTASVLTTNGWSVGVDGTWNLDGNTNPYNGGFPFLSWEYTPAAVPTTTPSVTPSPTAEPGTSHTYTALAFSPTGKKLTTSAKNYLSSVAEDIKSHGYTTITINGYANHKVSAKVARARTAAVKAYLLSSGVTGTYVVHNLLLDGVHTANTVVVTAAS